jgi:hypothetical protein
MSKLLEIALLPVSLVLKPVLSKLEKHPLFVKTMDFTLTFPTLLIFILFSLFAFKATLILIMFVLSLLSMSIIFTLFSFAMFVVTGCIALALWDKNKIRFLELINKGIMFFNKD